jgi:hypothetical protein
MLAVVPDYAMSRGKMLGGPGRRHTIVVGTSEHDYSPSGAVVNRPECC